MTTEELVNAEGIRYDRLLEREGIIDNFASLDPYTKETIQRKVKEWLALYSAEDEYLRYDDSQHFSYYIIPDRVRREFLEWATAEELNADAPDDTF